MNKPKTFTGFLNFIGVETATRKSTRYCFVDEVTNNKYKMLACDFNAIISKLERGLIHGEWACKPDGTHIRLVGSKILRNKPDKLDK